MYLKSLLLSFSFIALSQNIQAQVIVDSIDINQRDVQYILVEIRSLGLSSACRIYVDYGQRSNGAYRSDRVVLDENNTILKVNSVADGLNYLHKKGWEIMDVYAQHEEDGTFLMVLRE